MDHLRAILWAQWRSIRSTFPRSGGWVYVLGFFWYAGWLSAAIVIAKVVANPKEIGVLQSALPGSLLLIFLYWQVVPILMSATGASLDLQKLKVYPIPIRRLFVIEVLLRATAAVEMIIVLIGGAVGTIFNPKLPWASPFAIVPFVIFNLFFAVGVRDLVARMLRHKRVREIAVLLVESAMALPMLIATHPDAPLTAKFFSGTPASGWPWISTAHLFQGEEILRSLTWLVAWCAAAALFAAFQFRWTFASDRVEAPAAGFRPGGHSGFMERLFRWPSAVFSDPLAAMVEKEIRFLARSPRFRLVFLMGFTFGLVIWLPLSMGRGMPTRSFLGSNYLTVVSVYSLLLLSEVCFWNSFGFDRSAAQMYFLAPVSFSKVLAAKNVSAMFFIALEVGAITLICAVMGMPISFGRVAEAYSVAAVIALFLLGAGNLLSVQQARGVNPDATFRSGSPGRIQAMLFVIYPVAFFPIGLAYMARYAFQSELAFYGILVLDAAIGGVVYKLALDSAVSASEEKKEQMIAALSQGDGPIAA
jgi:ABC-2 type transport system permease protein